MTNQERLLAFFEAENGRDWEVYRGYLSPDVIWILHSRHERQICGIDAYMNTIIAAYDGNKDTFTCKKIYAGDSQNRVAAILMNNHRQYSCDIFDFQDGLIVREYEFLL